jgi:hypothetical protein
MTKTDAQRRREDAERKRVERQRKRDAGVPSAVQAQNAITEALSFAIASMNLRDCADGWVPVNAALIFAVSVDILCRRGTFDPDATKRVVRDILAPRQPHKMSSYLPSLNPQGPVPRYRTQAPDVVTRPR